MLAFLLLVIRIVLQTIQRLVHIPMIAINAFDSRSIKADMASLIHTGVSNLSDLCRQVRIWLDRYRHQGARSFQPENSFLRTRKPSFSGILTLIAICSMLFAMGSATTQAQPTHLQIGDIDGMVPPTTVTSGIDFRVNIRSTDSQYLNNQVVTTNTVVGFRLEGAGTQYLKFNSSTSANILQFAAFPIDNIFSRNTFI